MRRRTEARKKLRQTRSSVGRRSAARSPVKAVVIGVALDGRPDLVNRDRERTICRELEALGLDVRQRVWQLERDPALAQLLRERHFATVQRQWRQEAPVANALGRVIEEV